VKFDFKNRTLKITTFTQMSYHRHYSLLVKIIQYFPYILTYCNLFSLAKMVTKNANSEDLKKSSFWNNLHVTSWEHYPLRRISFVFHFFFLENNLIQFLIHGYIFWKNPYILKYLSICGSGPYVKNIFCHKSQVCSDVRKVIKVLSSWKE